jgi:hypothetical protein
MSREANIWERKREIENRSSGYSLKTRLPFFSFAIKSRLPPIFPHVIMLLYSFKAILCQPRAKIIATDLHYTMILVEIDNLR